MNVDRFLAEFITDQEIPIFAITSADDFDCPARLVGAPLSMVRVARP
jgi:hypothetical protein